MIRLRRAHALPDGSPRPVAGLLIGSAAALVAAFVPTVVASGDTDPGYVTVAASTSSQSNVSPGSALTGLTDGQTITLELTATGEGNTIPRVELRQCKVGSNISTFTQFRPSTGGRCASDDPVENQFKLPGGGDSAGTEFQDVPTDNFPTSNHISATFLVSTGTAINAKADTPAIVCDQSSSCELWLRVIEPQIEKGEAYLHYDLLFGNSTATTSTTAPGSGGSTTTTLGAGTTSTTAGSSGSTTSTTRASSTTSSSTSTTTSGASTTSTSTTLPSGTTVSPTVAPGGAITVSSTGWKPSSTVTGVLRSDPVTLGTLTADATGKISGSFNVLTTTAPGPHELELTGLAPSGAARTIKAGVTLTAPGGATTSSAGAGATTTTKAGTNLPSTGSSSFKVIWTGAGVLLAGALFIEAARRRRPFDRPRW